MRPRFIRPGQAGMTLLEIIIVISLMAVIYAVALPNFRVASGSEAATKLGGLASDIRGAFDMAVLYRRPYRLVINFVSGDYWLETTDRRDFTLGDSKLDRDPTEEEEKDAQEFFDEEFQQYVDLAGKEIEDPENSRTIKPTSPVVNAKEKLRPVKWTKVETREWGKRSIGPYLFVQDMQTEHHAQKQVPGDLGDKARAFLYFFPTGYAERAVIHVAYRKGDDEVDESRPPFTITTNPNAGTAEVETGYQEVNVLEYEPS